MPKVYRLKLTEAQIQELRKAAKSHDKPYVRERSAGILKVSEGNSLRQVAYHQLLRRHAPETLKEWCQRYLEEGLDGLLVKSGRGRKPSFFPSE